MVIYNKYIKPGTEKVVVSKWENRFVDSIKRIVDDICKKKSIRFVTLTGPTCAGKTTTAALLSKFFKEKGKSARVISVDDFYGEFANDRSDVNFESIEAIDMECFTDCIEKIMNKEDTKIPVFDFVTQSRSGYVDFPYEENGIVIIEGIQTLYPEIRKILPRETTKRIFIDVEKLVAYGVIFNKQYIRYCRRVVRDFQFRNSSLKRTINLLRNVAENEHDNIYPFRKLADYKVSSLMPYGINVIKDYLLNRIPYDQNDPIEMRVLKKLKEDLKKVPTMSEKFVPADSVYREFIG